MNICFLSYVHNENKQTRLKSNKKRKKKKTYFYILFIHLYINYKVAHK